MLQIMAMKHARVVIFTGAISALAVMTVLSGANQNQNQRDPHRRIRVATLP